MKARPPVSGRKVNIGDAETAFENGLRDAFVAAIAVAAFALSATRAAAAFVAVGVISFFGRLYFEQKWGGLVTLWVNLDAKDREPDAFTPMVTTMRRVVPVNGEYRIEVPRSKADTYIDAYQILGAQVRVPDPLAAYEE